MRGRSSDLRVLLIVELLALVVGLPVLVGERFVLLVCSARQGLVPHPRTSRSGDLVVLLVEELLVLVVGLLVLVGELLVLAVELLGWRVEGLQGLVVELLLLLLVVEL